MLPAEQIKQIATLLKVDETKLTEAIKSDKEETIDIAATLQTVTEEDLSRFKTTAYNDGKKAGVEMAVDDTKKEYGLDFTGKTMKGLAESIKKKTLEDAKIEPAEKVKELQKDLEILRSANETLKGQITEKDGAVNKAKIDREIFKHVPKSDSLTEDEFIGLMRMNGYDFKYEGNDLVAVKGDGIVKDSLAKPTPVKDVIAAFAKEKKLSSEEVIVGGRGGVDKKTGATFTKLSELKQHYTDQKKSTQGEEFLNHASKLKAANPEFDFNS
jgi:hypothetical protein